MEGNVGTQFLAVGCDGKLNRNGASTDDEDLEGVAMADEQGFLNVHDADMEGLVGQKHGFCDCPLHRARDLCDLLSVHKYVNVAVGATE